MTARPSSQEISPMHNGVDNPGAAVEDFFALIQNYVSNGGYQKLKNLIEENETLTKRVHDQNIAKEEIFDSIAKLKEGASTQAAQLDKTTEETRSLRKQLTASEADIEKKTSELKANSEEITKLYKQGKERDEKFRRLHESKASLVKSGDESAKTIKSLEQRLEIKEIELENQHTNATRLQQKVVRFQSFSIEMRSCEAIETTAKSSLGSIFTTSYALMEKFLYRDLSPGTLSNTVLWEPFKQFKIGANKIPLPISNTLPAKQMRLAVGLTVLAGALQRYIFQPLYISGEKDDLTKSLEDEFEDNPALDTYARGILLKVLSAEAQEANGQARARNAATTVSDIIAKIIPDEGKKAFETDLKRLCDLALKTWLPFQKVAERVEADFSYTDSPDEWQIFTFPSASRPAQAGKGKDSDSQQPKNANRKPGGLSQPGPRGQGTGGSESTNQALSSATAGPLSSTERVYEVWPAFVADDEDVTVLHHGYALTQEQVETASEEVQREEAPRRTERHRH